MRARHRGTGAGAVVSGPRARVVSGNHEDAMLYAVSIETSRPVRRGRLRRRVNVFVEARDGDEAQYLARLRFRHRPEARSLVVRGVRGVPLRMPQQTGAPVAVSTPPSSAVQRKRGAKRRKSKRYGSPGKAPRGNA